MYLTTGMILLFVVLDQLSKWCAVQYLKPLGTVAFLPGIMQLTFMLNDGAAFSIFSGRQGLLIGVTSVAIAVMLYILYARKVKGLAYWGLLLITAGGIGNLIDRVLYREVVDFFEVTFTRYAVFNVADCFVTVGCVLLAVGILFGDKKASSQKQVQTAAEPPKPSEISEPEADSTEPRNDD